MPPRQLIANISYTIAIALFSSACATMDSDAERVETGGPITMRKAFHGMLGGMKRCEKLLGNGHLMPGSVHIVANIGSFGEVLSATPTEIVGLSPRKIECLVAVVKSAQFPSPDAEGGRKTVVVPFTYVRTGPPPP